jgi:hypothetical protein
LPGHLRQRKTDGFSIFDDKVTVDHDVIQSDDMRQAFKDDLRRKECDILFLRQVKGQVREGHRMFG